MSSLRRRAIWVQRAMSTERSSIGARASARTTAGGVAGVGQQPQPGEQVADLGALEEGGVADQPVRDRALLERDRRPPAPRARSRRRSPRSRRASTCSRATSRSISAATAWACARSFAHRQNSTSTGVASVGSRSSRPAPPDSGPAPARRSDERRRAAVRAQQPHDACARRLERARAARRRRRGSARARPADRRRRSAPAGERPRERRRAEVELLGVVDQHVLERLAARRAGPRAADREPHEIALVAGAELAHHPVVRAEDRRRTRARAGCPAAAAQAANSSASISSALSRSIRRTKLPSSAPALPPKSWCWSGSSSIRSASIASRSPALSVASTRSARLPARRSTAAAKLRRRDDEQLAVAVAQLLLERARAASARAGDGVSSTIRSGSVPCSTSQRKRSRISRVLPLPAAPRISSGLPL